VTRVVPSGADVKMVLRSFQSLFVSVFYRYRYDRHRPSFPTRRSSDLNQLAPPPRLSGIGGPLDCQTGGMTMKRLHILSQVVLCLALPLGSFGQAAPHASSGNPIATVGGQPIYEQDLIQSLGPQLLQLRNQEYQLKSKALDDLIRQKLIEAEANKRGLLFKSCWNRKPIPRLRRRLTTRWSPISLGRTE